MPRSSPAVSTRAVPPHCGCAGAAKIADLLAWCEEARVEIVTLWLLSTDNLKRPPEELAPLLEIIADVVDAFLASIEEEPHLWRFVVHPTLERATDSVVEDAREQIARMLATLIGGRLRQLGLDSGGAEAWAHGLVGMVQSAGDWWLERRTMSRSALTDYLTTLIWGGVSGVLGTAEPASIAPLRAVGQEDARG